MIVDDHLNEHLFRSPPAAPATHERCCNDPNAGRPHPSLDGLAPDAFANRLPTRHNPNDLRSTLQRRRFTLADHTLGPRLALSRAGLGIRVRW